MKRDVCLTVKKNGDTVFYGEVLNLNDEAIAIEVYVTDAAYEITPIGDSLVIRAKAHI